VGQLKSKGRKKLGQAEI